MIAAIALAAPAMAQSTIRLENQTCGAASDVVVPISVTPADGVTTMDFVFSYEGAVLSVAGVYRTGFTSQFSLSYDIGTPGMVSIHMTGTPALAGSGQVAWVLFHAIGAAGTTAHPTWISAALNGGSLPAQTQNGTVTITSPMTVVGLPDGAQVGPGAQGVRVPISATAFTGGDSFDFTVQFNQAVIAATSVEKTPLTQSLTLTFNVSTPGIVRIALFGTHGINGPGDLVRIVYNVTGPLGSQTPLDITRGQINEGLIPTTLDDGLLTVCNTSDADGDGFTGCAGDCDDANPLVHPGASEVCNGVNDDCNPATADGSGESWYGLACDGTDDDLCAEGVFACQGGQQTCTDETGTTVEICNGVDDDCDGSVDEGVTITFYRDADADGYGDSVISTQACQAPAGYVGNSTDCDDANPAVHPGTADTSCDDVDENCDGSVDEGFVPQPTVCGVGECASTGMSSCVSGNIHPNCTPGEPSPETCDGQDNDCDGATDNAPPPAGVPALRLTWQPPAAVLIWTGLSGATAYDIVRGRVLVLQQSLGDFTAATETCLANNLTETSFEDGGAPEADDALWYLVRGKNCGGTGTYDSGSTGQVGERDAEIAAAASSCP